MKRILFAFLSFTVIASCRQPSSDIVAIPISFSDYQEIEAFSPSEIYDANPIYIKLKTKDNVDYAFKELEQVIVRDSLIYLREFMGKKIDIFNLSGEPVSILDYKGRGPGEYLQITDFDVDNKGNLWIVDGQKDKIFKYSPDCIYQSSWPFVYDICKIRCLNNNKFAYQLAPWDKSSYAGAELIIADSLFSVNQNVLYYNKNKDVNFAFTSVFSDIKGGYFYCDPISEYLYEFTNDGEIKEIYHLDFGDKNVPEKLKNNVEKYFSDILENYMFIYSSYKLTPRYITFGLKHKGSKSIIIDRVRGIYASYGYDDSDFFLVGQYDKGTIWQVLSVSEDSTLPEPEKKWVNEGNDLLVLYPDDSIIE